MVKFPLRLQISLIDVLLFHSSAVARNYQIIPITSRPIRQNVDPVAIIPTATQAHIAAVAIALLVSSLMLSTLPVVDGADHLTVIRIHPINQIVSRTMLHAILCFLVIWLKIKTHISDIVANILCAATLPKCN